MTSFDTAWEQAQGFGCRICNKPQYNDSGLCTQCSRMEQQLHESGAYQKRKAPNLDEVIDRLIWEQRDKSKHPLGRPNRMDEMNRRRIARYHLKQAERMSKRK